MLYFGQFVCVGRREVLCSVEKNSSYWAFVLRRVVRVELEVFISVCGFPVDDSINSSIGIPGCLDVEKWDRCVFFFLYRKFDVLVDGVKMGVDKVYVLQTSSTLRSRTREHKRAIFRGQNSLLAQHCVQNNHEFDLDDVNIFYHCSQWSKGYF